MNIKDAKNASPRTGYFRMNPAAVAIATGCLAWSIYLFTRLIKIKKLRMRSDTPFLRFLFSGLLLKLQEDGTGIANFGFIRFITGRK